MNMNARNVSLQTFHILWLNVDKYLYTKNTDANVYVLIAPDCRSKGSLLWKHFKRHLKNIKGEQKL